VPPLRERRRTHEAVRREDRRAAAVHDGLPARVVRVSEHEHGWARCIGDDLHAARVVVYELGGHDALRSRGGRWECGSTRLEEHRAAKVVAALERLLSDAESCVPTNASHLSLPLDLIDAAA
jgi:hypothetical protein